MSHETTTVVDKSAWGEGPWQGEPDRVDFEHAGLPCFTNRHPRYGFWCGYAGVAPGHPHYGKNYQQLEVEVHGGLTYSAPCWPICHTPKPGEPDDVWWFGFDCGHAWDLSPGRRMGRCGLDAERDDPEWKTYRDLAYVRRQTELLAEQLAAKDHSNERT
jgi:hypothetical protein